MKIIRIGLDLAKDVFQVHGVDKDEVVIARRQLKRREVLKYFAKLDRIDNCVLGIESCCGSDHWARELSKLGYQVKIMNPAFVKPYVKGNKNDAHDAEAICEAVSRPSMRFIPVKTLEQQDLLLLHRAREQYVKRRTALSNQIRGTLINYGIVIKKRIENVRAALPLILEDGESELSFLARSCFEQMRQELIELDEKIKNLDNQLNVIAEQNEHCAQLMSIPGIGPITATAFVGYFGDASQFAKGRQCAAYLGLVPAQHSSGGKENLLGISKRGNRYLRMLLIHGARSVLKTVKVKREKMNNGTLKSDVRVLWLSELSARKHHNVSAVALANKNARMAWALLTSGAKYNADHRLAA